MKLSQLIEQLQAIETLDGDLEVYEDVDNYGASLLRYGAESSLINETDAMNDPDLEDLIGTAIVRLT